MSVYLDHNASAAIRPEAVQAVLASLEAGGNPSSVHGPGRTARATVERAREILGRHIKARAEDIVFTSGGTEANNLAIASARHAGATRLAISAIEHEAVRDAALASGLAVDVWPVSADGVADLDWLEDYLKHWKTADGTAFLALMAANNETGVIQPIEAAGRMIREAGGLFHVDAVQMPGKADFDMAASLAHYVALSAHKAGGPLGAGALALACDAPLARLIHGGGQEKGRRSGTENAPAIAGFAAGLEAAVADADLYDRLAFLRDLTEARIRASAPEATVWGEGAERLPNTLCLSAPGWPSEIQVIALDLAGFAVSAGAACSSGKVKQSRVLDAMGAGAEAAASAVRISFGWNNTEDDAIAFADVWLNEYARVRARPALAG